MTDEIIVSVLCTAYNHEKYIRHCLDGFVMQKTNFRYEVLINDDASTDNTAAIIREYEEKYPEIIKPIYQTENQFSKKVRITREVLFPRAGGKYIALCEGDDYWIDPLKLQKQVDALERHPECHMSVCRVSRVSEDEQTEVGVCPAFPLEEGVIPSERFLNKVFREYAFHTSSYVMTSSAFKRLCTDPPAFVSACPVGDEAYMLYFGAAGDVYYCSDTMSCNRRGSIGGWNSRTWSNPEHRRNYFLGMARTYECFDEYTCGKYHDQCRDRIFHENYFLAETSEDFCKLLHDEPEVFRRQSRRTKIRVFVGTYCHSLLKLYYKLTKQVVNN